MKIKIAPRVKETPGVKKICSIFKRRISERFGEKVLASKGKPDFVVIFDMKSGIGRDGFTIKTSTDQAVITGNDERGLLYGAGKLLRSLRLENGKFFAGWSGTSVPKKEIRGIYFATHFHNFYHDAPMKEVETYLEDIALWGYNALIVWFDMHHYTGIDDPEAQKMLIRLRSILSSCREIGISPGIGRLANEGYSTTPVGLRAKPTGRGHYGVEVCPSIPEGEKLILKQAEQECQAFCDIGLEFVWIWPYDQGGCRCKKCSPWGANAYPVISEKVGRVFKRYYPCAKIALSTWLFDDEEWKGLARVFRKRPTWIDYLIADAHETFPEYLLNNPVPGNLPLLNFPEISMWMTWPWGGYGANPLPERFQMLWDSVSDRIAGGFPYSEGIFEDINKAVYSQFYWNNTPARETIREYVASEFSDCAADQLLKVIGILEKNHGLSTWNWATKPNSRKAVDILNQVDHGSETAYRIMKDIDRKLPARVRKSWRWRILFLRAMLDYKLRRTDGVPDKEAESGFRELNDIYHTWKGTVQVRAPFDADRFYRRKSQE